MLRLGSVVNAVLRGGACMCVLLGGVCSCAQQNQTPVFTLKVYADLVQLPTLVLDSERQPLRRINSAQFRVSLDGGKKFAPTRVRPEGDDPLDVAIFLDMSGSQRHLISSFASAAGALASSLHPQDRVSVYAFNCQLVRSGRQLMPQTESLSHAVEGALGAPAVNEGYVHGRCAKQPSLWDAMTVVVHEMSVNPARRAMLVVSEGDVSGFVSWDRLHRYAADEGVALFGLNDGFAYTYDPLRRPSNDPFRQLCESTGGVVMYAQPRDLDRRLKQWVTMLRDRYVIEFPRPQRISEGMHSIVVSVRNDPAAFVTLAGVGVSLPDPSLTNDPHYLPSQEGADIPVGTKRPAQH